MRIASTVSPDNITVFIKGRNYGISASDKSFKDLADHLRGADHDVDYILSIVDKPTVVARMTDGDVSVVGNAVLYKGTEINSTLTERLLWVLDEGFDVRPWARFLEKVMKNPSDKSRDGLFTFLDKYKVPITEDGNFLVFKRVRGDFKDIHSGTFDNSPGTVVEMVREDVQNNPNICNAGGLHVCATQYLGSFYANDSNSRIVVCSVSPTDVVAVPTDYNFAKMRVCKYLVVCEADPSIIETAYDSPISDVADTESSVFDMSGYPLCYDASTFADNWKRDPSLKIVVGSYVVQSLVKKVHVNEVPSNIFAAGVVTSIADDGTTVTVEWQDGSEGVYTAGVSIEKDDLSAVSYIGAPIDERDYEDYWNNFYKEFGEEEGYNDFEVENYANELAADDAYWAELDFDDHGNFDYNGEEEDHGEEEDTTGASSTIALTREGVDYTYDQIIDGVKRHGQRGYSRLTGIPRSTLQDALCRIGR